MNMTEFDVYRHYLALKLHFTTDKYDVIKLRGRVKASRQAFLKRKDLLSIRKIAITYNDKEIVDFLIANFVSGDRWGGMFDVEAKNRYLDWKRRIESISYTFEKEFDRVIIEGQKKNLPLEGCFIAEHGQHPLIVKLYLRNAVSIETLVILNKLNNYVEQLDQRLVNDLIWPDLSRIIKKYSPFLTIDKEKYETIIRKRTDHF